jgi:dTDP-4-dehydrorhamnose 3,5-epimerase
MVEFEEIEGISQAWVRHVPRFNDRRGYFSEEFRRSSAPMVIPDFVQDSLSYSKKNVLRGMHLQIDQWQLVTLIKGELMDVLVDLSVTSPTYLQSVSLELSELGRNQLLLRPGIAHGYGVLSEEALIHYKSSVYYGDTAQFGVHWRSKELVGCWPMLDWEISDRDSSFPILEEAIPEIRLHESKKTSYLLPILGWWHTNR